MAGTSSNKVTAVILQPNYLPWKGYFDQISQADIFVFFDDVQFTSKSWRTRNRFLGAQGEFWLSVPVKKAPRTALIREICIDNSRPWQQKHWEAIRNTYAGAEHADTIETLCHDIFFGKRWESLLELNVHSTQVLSSFLGLHPTWYFSSSLGCTGSREGSRALEILSRVGATHLLNGPSARDFIDTTLFSSRGMGLSYMEYDYPVYPRKSDLFSHHVSIFDVIANCGENSMQFIKSRNPPLNVVEARG